MPMKVRYNVVDGETVSEQRAGVKSFYVPDALGSTIAIQDNTGVITDRLTYWPFGEVASHVGTATTPFKYCGEHGYYADGSDRAYVRRRILVNVLARWLTADPLYFDGGSLNLYEYATSNPISHLDPTGLFCIKLPIIGCIGNTCAGDPKCPPKKPPNPPGYPTPPPIPNLPPVVTPVTMGWNCTMCTSEIQSLAAACRQKLSNTNFEEDELGSGNAIKEMQKCMRSSAKSNNFVAWCLKECVGVVLSVIQTVTGDPLSKIP